MRRIAFMADTLPPETQMAKWKQRNSVVRVRRERSWNRTGAAPRVRICHWRQFHPPAWQ